ncbi:YkvI family membrane protein [Megasphaera hominis]|jgi:uncharacterized membrane protein YkvI|uniref:Transporter n=1 Tax=Megasphaera hominis TaxID=159836 RepID=A0ABR6VJA6_9FIRM|nr:hypothetical protein [Megasphaera hominis]MBC3537238.1 hypothetical protein [Megasphaera hominis]
MHMKTALTVGGAFTAYCIGAGFASGQETLQFYGSWGGVTPFLLVIFTFVLMFIFCLGTYRTGALKHFENPSEAYTYYCGRHLGFLIDILCTLSIALCTLIMFAGSGATINQYLGVPVWIGTTLMGIVAVFVVCLGLQKVVDILGCAGIIIIAIMAVVGVYCLVTSPVGIMEGQQHVLEYVQEGRILQGTFMGIDNCVVAVFSLVGAYITLGLLFNVSLGASCKTKQDIWGSAFLSALFFCIGLSMVLLTLIKNLDYIAAIKAQVPMLAAIENVLPIMAMPFTIIILIGIFTTITGYLWAFGRRFAEDKTKKQRIIVIVVAVLGMTVASFVPLSQLVNTIYPLVGIGGDLLLIGILYRMLRAKE